MGNGIGIASFVLSLILCVLTFIVLPIMVWRAIAMSASVGSIANSGVAAAATFGIVLLVLTLIALILGIVGTVTSEKKIFGILGLVFSVLCLLFLLGAMALGASMIRG